MVSMADIEQLAAKIVHEFRPEKVILFGSHARGTAGPDSDVDLLVVDSFSGKGWRRAVEILGRVQPNFPIDLLVRKPEEIEWRVQAGDPFINDIVNEGVILHAADHSGMD